MNLIARLERTYPSHSSEGEITSKVYSELAQSYAGYDVHNVTIHRDYSPSNLFNGMTPYIISVYGSPKISRYLPIADGYMKIDPTLLKKIDEIHKMLKDLSGEVL